MGWATKNSKRWELGQLRWTFASIALVPIPIHPFVMMGQAMKGKVRSWFVLSWMLLAVQVALFYSFFIFAGAASQGLFLTILGLVGSYILGNGLLLSQSKAYLRRLEQGQVRELSWINTLDDQRRLALIQVEVETPQSFVDKLIYYKKEINNPCIQENLDKIISLFQLIEKRDIMEAEKFLVRHGTVISIAREYHDLESTKLNNTITIESKEKLEGVLRQATLAIELDVTTLLKNRLLDVSAESDVYLQTLKNKNLLKD